MYFSLVCATLNHFEFDHEGKVIRRNELMRTADNLIFGEPSLVQGSENAENRHSVAGTEDVIDDAFKVESVVGKEEPEINGIH